MCFFHVRQDYTSFRFAGIIALRRDYRWFCVYFAEKTY
ncbi:MAG: hypothetical protein ACI9HK_003453 [Pirellulaceae bacterium]|jgi:hypothetical protein